MAKIQIRKIARKTAKLFGILKFGLAVRRSTITEGQRFPNVCCTGFDIEVLSVNTDKIAIRCLNSRCPKRYHLAKSQLYGAAEDELPDYLVEAH